jgi:hypothetical protein
MKKFPEPISLLIILPFVFYFLFMNLQSFISVVWGFNIYWANLHSHTSLSDGEGLPTEAYQYARDSAQIDVLAITDHTHYLTENSYRYLINITSQYTESGRFVALAGQEFGSLGAFGHFSIFETENLYPYSVNNLKKFYEWTNNHQVIAQFNHPRSTDFNYLAYSRDGDQFISTFEIVNGSGTYTPYYEELYIKALNNGWHVAPVANQDNHRGRWGNTTTALGQIPLTGVWADSLTKKHILEALRNRRVYAVEVKPPDDRILLWDFSIGNTKMGGIYFSLDQRITIKAKVSARVKFQKIYLYRSGIISDSVVTDTNYLDLIFNDTMTNGYYFIKGVQADGDRFWTAPIWVNYRSEPQEIQAWPSPIKSRSKIVFPIDKSWSPRIQEMLVYNPEGRLVYKEHKEFPSEFFWDGKDMNDRLQKNGIYYVVIKLTDGIKNKTYKGKVALLIER